MTDIYIFFYWHTAHSYATETIQILKCVARRKVICEEAGRTLKRSHTGGSRPGTEAVQECRHCCFYA